MTAAILDMSVFKEVKDLKLEVERLEYLKYTYEDGDNSELDGALQKEIEKRIYNKLPHKKERIETLKKLMNLTKGD